MKQIFGQIATLGTLLVLILFLNGCYTQVGTVRSERYGDESIQEAENEDVAEESEADTTDESYEDQRDRLYYDYYYPPSYPYSHGWYRPYGWYGYDPFWCGTYYPYYGWWPPSYFYYPGYYTLPYGSGYSRYAVAGGRSHGVRRTIGNIRSSGSVRATNEGTNERARDTYLPTGSQSRPTIRREARGTGVTPNPTSTGRREGSVSSTRSSRGKSVDRAGNSRSGSTRSGVPRQISRAPQQPPPPPSAGGRGSSGSSRGEQSYTPPPSSKSAPSSPPPASGPRSSGGTRSGGSSRDGGRR